MSYEILLAFRDRDKKIRFISTETEVDLMMQSKLKLEIHMATGIQTDGPILQLIQGGKKK